MWNVLEIFSKCTRNVLEMYSKCTQNVLKMYSEFTQNVLRMYSECTQNVLEMYSICTQYALDMYSLALYEIVKYCFGFTKNSLLHYYIRLKNCCCTIELMHKPICFMLTGITNVMKHHSIFHNCFYMHKVFPF